MSPVNETHRFRRYSTTPDLIAESLRDEILRGEIPAGQPLRQEELAERFGVSRLPVRDALLRLEAQGLVHVFPNRGAFVISLSADDVREVYEMRVLLEGDMLERAVPRMREGEWRGGEESPAGGCRSRGAGRANSRRSSSFGGRSRGSGRCGARCPIGPRSGW